MAGMTTAEMCFWIFHLWMPCCEAFAWDGAILKSVYVLLPCSCSWYLSVQGQEKKILAQIWKEKDAYILFVPGSVFLVEILWHLH